MINDVYILMHIEAVNYFDLIDWSAEPCTEPPLTIDFDLDTIKGAFQKPIILPAYPNDTQAVERMVRVVTEVATQRAGYTGRHRCLNEIFYWLY